QPDKDRLIFLGDYIDRGKDPKGVVDYILALVECSSHVECLWETTKACSWIILPAVTEVYSL
ncbi:MAG: hypothetical protein SV775_18795, partial [Thermodesulfobacteriota bacterium]|nr:hypothetical protein [Thermodesulfobacteriota bacterium]